MPPILDQVLMNVNTEDITVPWGQQPHPMDAQNGKWRFAVFQDMQESMDMSKLYFLYDPQADEGSGTSGTRKGYPGLIIFDVNFKCFAAEIPLHCQGTMKFLFSLKCPSPAGGTSFVLVTEEQVYGQIRLHLFRVDMSGDGLSVTNYRPLLDSPLTIGGEYICSMREDSPEIVICANPGMQVWRVNAMAESPQSPTAFFQVADADLSHFYDGFLSNGLVHLLSASPDGDLDYSRIHVMGLDNQGQINTHNCSGDPNRGMPPPRKQAAIDSVANAILVAGGEVDQGYDVQRLVDYWVLDTRTFQWTQVPAQMPCPLIEPRLTTTNSGNVYLWGDFDQPLPGMPAGGTHLRIFRITGMDKAGHPPPYSADPSAAPPMYPSAGGPPAPYPPAGGEPSKTFAAQQAPPYPSFNPNQGAPQQNPGYQQQNPGYPQQNAGYPQQNPGYPQQNPGYQQQNPGYPQQNPGYPQQNYGGGPADGFTQQPYSDGQTAFYPPQKQKKDCCIQ